MTSGIGVLKAKQNYPCACSLFSPDPVLRSAGVPVSIGAPIRAGDYYTLVGDLPANLACRLQVLQGLLWEKMWEYGCWDLGVARSLSSYLRVGYPNLPSFQNALRVVSQQRCGECDYSAADGRVMGVCQRCALSLAVSLQLQVGGLKAKCDYCRAKDVYVALLSVGTRVCQRCILEAVARDHYFQH